MKRRGFLGIIGGAVAAGPSMAKNAVAQLPSGLGIESAVLGSAGVSSASSLGSGDWMLEEIANLRRFISGELTDEEQEDRRRAAMYARQSLISNRYAGLKSVADWRKVDLFNRDLQRLNEEINRSQARGRLASLLKQVAP